MLVLTLLFSLLPCLPTHNVTQSSNSAAGVVRDVQETSYGLREEAVEIREEAQKMRSEAYNTMNKAYQIKEEALELREGANEVRVELESSIVETLSLMRSQATVSTLYLQEIRNTLNTVTERLDDLERKVDSNVKKITGLQESIENNGEVMETVKSRQELVMSEVRLISLYKMTDQTSTYEDSAGSDLAVDGQFVFSQWDSTQKIRTVTHTGDQQPNNKLWIDLGGLFRIHRVKIWNSRHADRGHFIGTHIYGDERIIGVAVEGKSIYDFVVPDEDPAYAQTITLQQTLAKWLIVVEVQVWGTGPYSKDDIFA